MRTLVVDDEPLAREGLAGYVEETPGLSLVGQCQSAPEALQVLQQETVDLLLLDINMPQMTGLELIRTLTQPPLVILTTAYREHALEGYELNVVDYLLKPISLARFLQSIEKAKERHRAKDAPTAFFVKQDQRVIRIKFEEVLFVEGLKDYLQIYTAEDKYLVLQSMKQAEAQLPKTFLRTHRSYIVNSEKVDALEGNQLLIGPYKIPISRQHKEAVVQQIIGDNLWSRG